MGSVASLPYTSVSGNEAKRPRARRLRQAYTVMSRIVDLVWPDDGSPDDPGHVAWRGAILSMHEAEGQLLVSWKDAEHLQKYRKAAELGWAAVGEDDENVLHDSADPVDGSAYANDIPF